MVNQISKYILFLYLNINIIIIILCFIYINLLLKMITLDENQRVDFIGLEKILQEY